MTPGQRADARIKELGIQDPRELDVEAIAFDAGLRVEYAPLNGCEAMLVGVGSHAIATIKSGTVKGRERFSIGHELGHWELHRGRSFRCRVDEPIKNLEPSNAPAEREADEFASHLLMPTRLFNPRLTVSKWPTIGQLDDIAVEFQASRQATAIRIAKVDSLPVIVACYSEDGLVWWVPAPHVPKRWWLKRKLDSVTFAHDLLTQGKECNTPKKQSADAWFENDDADEFEILEQSFVASMGRIIAILYLSDAEMFDRGFDPNVGWRK